MKRFISIIAAAAIMLLATPVYAENEAEDTVKLDTDAKSCILMEESSGQILYEENADEQLPIARRYKNYDHASYYGADRERSAEL